MQEERYRNFTPFEVVYQANDGDEPRRFPSEGSAFMDEREATLLGQWAGVNLHKTRYGDILQLPPPEPGVKYIVPFPTAMIEAWTATKPRTDLVYPDTGKTARRDGQRVLSVRAFCVFDNDGM